MHIRPKLTRASSYRFGLKLPLGLLQHVLQEQQLELIQQQLLGKGTEQTLHEKGEKGVVVFLPESVVTHHRHSLDYHSHPFVELHFLVLETLLSVELNRVLHRLRHLEFLKELDTLRGDPCLVLQGLSR